MGDTFACRAEMVTGGRPAQRHSEHPETPRNTYVPMFRRLDRIIVQMLLDAGPRQPGAPRDPPDRQAMP